MDTTTPVTVTVPMWMLYVPVFVASVVTVKLCLHVLFFWVNGKRMARLQSDVDYLRSELRLVKGFGREATREAACAATEASKAADEIKTAVSRVAALTPTQDEWDGGDRRGTKPDRRKE
jgi:hypothetical protein